MGSEMCIRDSIGAAHVDVGGRGRGDLARDQRPADSAVALVDLDGCLLYTSDAADERSSVDLGGRRIIKKKKTVYNGQIQSNHENREHRIE